MQVVDEVLDRVRTRRLRALSRPPQVGYDDLEVSGEPVGVVLPDRRPSPTEPVEKHDSWAGTLLRVAELNAGHGAVIMPRPCGSRRRRPRLRASCSRFAPSGGTTPGRTP